MTEQTRNKSTFGLISVVLGFIAFAAVVGHFFAGPIDPPPPVEVSIADKAVEIRDATVAALKGEEYEAEPEVRPRTLDDYMTLAFMGIAAVAILMAVIGFIQHERLRPSIAGAALDTHYTYPMPADHTLWSMPNVIMTPHISGSSQGGYFLPRIWDLFTQNVARWRAGRPLLNELTPAQLAGA